MPVVEHPVSLRMQHRLTCGCDVRDENGSNNTPFKDGRRLAPPSWQSAMMICGTHAFECLPRMRQPRPGALVTHTHRDVTMSNLPARLADRLHHGRGLDGLLPSAGASSSRASSSSGPLHHGRCLGGLRASSSSGPPPKRAALLLTRSCRVLETPVRHEDASVRAATKAKRARVPLRRVPLRACERAHAVFGDRCLPHSELSAA